MIYAWNVVKNTLKKITKRISYRQTWRFNLDEEYFIRSSITGRSLNVCCGKSELGTVRVDLDEKHNPDLVCDYFKLPYKECEFDTVIFDPPFRDFWKHGLSHAVQKIGKLASKRFIVKGYLFIAHIRGFDLPNIEIFYQPNKKLKIIQVYERIPEKISLFLE
jgi:16S rRNA G966 N2-methylase RsmD